jgi:molybdate/tungstate transport system substrate-binding protein
MQEDWYAKAGLTLADGKQLQAQPLVFYATVLGNAKQPALGADFVRLLQGAEGQAAFRERGYDPPHGDAL